MGNRIQALAIIGCLVLLFVIFETIRKRRLREQYALVWILAGLVLLLLAIRRDLLTQLSQLMGIYYPPSALLVIGIGFIVLVLLSFSVAVSEMSEKVTRLAQRLALLEGEIRAHRDFEILVSTHSLDVSEKKVSVSNADVITATEHERSLRSEDKYE